MKAAICVRLSKDTDTSTSIERQREACQDVCEARGLAVADVYEDAGVSGFTTVTRPGRDALLERPEEYDALVVFKLDRLARNTRDAVD